jgi:NTP pyrophosphatase (non-canonical NTP hydrolase)
VCIEAAELLEIFQWDSMTLEETKRDSQRMDALKKELADVLIYCFDMAVLLELDTTEIIREKLELVKKKYPADHMKKSTKKDTGLGNDSTYHAIKQMYRRGISDATI